MGWEGEVGVSSGRVWAQPTLELLMTKQIAAVAFFSALLGAGVTQFFGANVAVAQEVPAVVLPVECFGGPGNLRRAEAGLQSMKDRGYTVFIPYGSAGHYCAW